ncbi:MAG: DMT family transporter [Clostridiales bacterium]|nr:DMT family transporter [Clostridiales bacterium]
MYINNTNKTSIRSDLSLILVAVIWGSGFIATKMAMDLHVSSSIIMTVRFLIATIFIFHIFRKKLNDFTRLEFKYGIITGLLLFLAFFAQTIGLEYTVPSNSAFITSTTVVMVPFISWIIISRRPTKRVFLAVLCSIMGIAVLTNLFSTSSQFNIGDALTLLAAFLFACHVSFLEISTKKMTTEKLSFLQFATAAMLSSLSFILIDFESVYKIEVVTGFIPVIYLGIFSTGIAFFIQTKAQKSTNASKVAIILSAEAIFASIFSVILGYELVTSSLIIGGVLVMSAIVIMEKDTVVQMLSFSKTNKARNK